MSERTILVTGAGGFLGSRLVEAIHRTGFGTPRGGIRRWGSAARAARFPIEFVLCDIENSAQASAACQGANTVVHTAYTDTREAIVDGTRNMLTAALANDVERFVYISSAEAYGPHVSGVVDETQPCQPTGNFYGDAKLEAEQLVQEFNQRGLATTILRPAIIYGPFSQSWTIDLATKLQSGNWGQFAEYGEGICNLVHVDDLVRAILLVVDQEVASGEIFNVVGPERPTWNEYFARFNAQLGLPPLRTIETKSSSRTSFVRDRINVVTGFILGRFEEPLMRLYLRGGPLSVVMKRVKTKLKTTPSAAELRGLYSRQAEMSHEKASRLLGYQPQVDLDSGLRMCHQWLAFHGFLDNVAQIAQPGEV